MSQPSKHPSVLSRMATSPRHVARPATGLQGQRSLLSTPSEAVGGPGCPRTRVLSRVPPHIQSVCGRFANWETAPRAQLRVGSTDHHPSEAITTLVVHGPKCPAPLSPGETGASAATARRHHPGAHLASCWGARRWAGCGGGSRGTAAGSCCAGAGPSCRRPWPASGGKPPLSAGWRTSCRRAPPSPGWSRARAPWRETPPAADTRPCVCEGTRWNTAAAGEPPDPCGSSGGRGNLGVFEPSLSACPRFLTASMAQKPPHLPPTSWHPRLYQGAFSSLHVAPGGGKARRKQCWWLSHTVPLGLPWVCEP